jgi:hypothetical protein
MIAQAVTAQREQVDVTRFPSDRVHFVPRSQLALLQLAHLSDLTYTIDRFGNLHYAARVIPRGAQVESDGDYDQRVTLARAELEKFMNDRGFAFWLDRDTSLTAAHNSTGQKTDYMKDVSAALLFGTYKRVKETGAKEFAIPQTPSYRYQFTPKSHREIIDKYEDLIGSKLRKAKVSSKGYAIANANFLCPNPMLGIIEHNGEHTTWQDFSAMLVTNCAVVAEENPQYKIFTRPSLIKDKLNGVPSSSTAIEWFGLSCQMKVKDYDLIQSAGSPEEREKRQREIRDCIQEKQTVDRKRLANGYLEPYREGMVTVTKLQDPVLEERAKLNNPINGSPPNPESGYVLHQIIAAGEECGMLGDPQVLHSHLQLNRLYEMAIEEIERYGEDLTLTKKQKEDSEDSQIEFATMTVSKTDGTPAFTGRSFSATERITWQINSPGQQHSRFWKEQQTYYLPDGSRILRYKDKDTGQIRYREPFAASELHETRDKYNLAVAQGITSAHGYTATCFSSEAPNDMEMTPAMATALHKIRYANFMDANFKRSSYWMCSVFADIQSLGFEIPGLKRLLLFHTGYDPEVRKGKKSAPPVYRGYSESRTSSGRSIKDLINEHIKNNPRLLHIADTLKATMRAPIIRKTGFDDRVFELRTDKDGLFPWFDYRSPFYLFMEARFLDQRAASRPKWVNPLEYQPGKEQVGYLRFNQYAGIDLELPLHCYLQLFCAGMVNIYEEIHKEAEKLVPAHLKHKLEIDIHQTDGTRQWNTFYSLLRMPDDVRRLFSRTSTDFFHTIAQEALVNCESKRSLSKDQMSDLKVSFDGEDAFTIFRSGKDQPKVMESYFEAVVSAYQSRLAQEGFSVTETKAILQNIRLNKIGYLERLHSVTMKGGSPDPLISQTFNAAITFLIGVSARVKVKWPKNKDFPDSDEESTITASGPFRKRPLHNAKTVQADIENLSVDSSRTLKTIEPFLSRISDDFSQNILSLIFDGLSGGTRPITWRDLEGRFNAYRNRIEAMTSSSNLLGVTLGARMVCPPDIKDRVELWFADGGDESEYQGSLAEDSCRYLLHCLFTKKDPGAYLSLLLPHISQEYVQHQESDIFKYLMRLLRQDKEPYAIEKANIILLNSLVHNWIDSEYPPYLPSIAQINQLREIFVAQLPIFEARLKTQ